jgi:hypothetical protein
MTNPATQGANTYLPPSPVVPMFLEITSITRANPMVVTTSTQNSWIAGQKAYFSIPFNYGMQQLNTLTAQITSVDTTGLIFTFALNSTQFDPFSVPSNVFQDATMSPSGSSNIYNFTTLPFHALDGAVGN